MNSRRRSRRRTGASKSSGTSEAPAPRARRRAHLCIVSRVSAERSSSCNPVFFRNLIIRWRQGFRAVRAWAVLVANKTGFAGPIFCSRQHFALTRRLRRLIILRSRRSITISHFASACTNKLLFTKNPAEWEHSLDYFWDFHGPNPNPTTGYQADY